jgi:hypothetical protein
VDYQGMSHSVSEYTIRTVIWFALQLVSVRCRPYAEFMAAKRATATALVEAVCRAGWCIQSSAAQAIAASGILSKANSPLSSLRGSLWALSSCIAGLDQHMNSTAASGKDPAAEPARILVALCSLLARAIRAAHQDDRLATDMPPAYDWLHTLAMYVPASASCRAQQ